MAGPGISGVACALLFERGRCLEALGIAVRPNWWWLLAYAAGIAFSGIALAANIFAGGGVFSSPPRVLQFAVSFLLINPVVQTLLATLEEELGWRGYLYGLWRQHGFWRYSLGTGIVWGVWHVPGIILFKINYPDLPWIGAAILVLLCMLFAPLMALARDRGGSVIAAGILHGVANATEIASMLMVKSASPLWQGDAGAGGLIAATFFLIVIAVFRRYSHESSISHPLPS
jgi:uncharacterized protein